MQQIGYETLDAGSYHVNVAFPALWLAAGVYTIYVKFIGYSPAGVEERHNSERALIDVVGAESGISRSVLSPPFDWDIQPAPSENSSTVSLSSSSPTQ